MFADTRIHRGFTFDTRFHIQTTRLIKRTVVGLAIVFLAVFLLAVIQSFHSPKSVDFSYERITVQKGDTLWELAAKIDKNSDINTLVNRTMKYNNLRNTYIQPGQVIYIPVRL